MGNFIDLTGKKFNYLTVISKVESKNGHTRWLCQCDCGTNTVVESGHLKRGDIKSCGCLVKTFNRERFIDLTGKKFNMLTAIRIHSKDKYNHANWLCKCDCGNETIVAGSNLRSGQAVSCGCYKKERMGNLNKSHNLKYTRIYNIWARMKQRCNNNKDPGYKHYGGRGIKVCGEWQEFKPFYDWSMANGYTEELTLDRINVNRNYEPSNCRWVDMKTQANNKTNTIYWEYNNETHTISEWADILDTTYNTLWQRKLRGWSVEQILSKPIRKAK